MADESQYSTATDTTPPSNKRKFDDQSAPPPSTRRQTGFSSPISDPAPPPSYNNVPPPADELQMAKQKAQEIAAFVFEFFFILNPERNARYGTGAFRPELPGF